MKRVNNRVGWLSVAVCTAASFATCHGQTVIGSAGAGFQNWTVANLNNNNAPFWDAVTESFGGSPAHPKPDSKNVGFCLTGGGDCVGINSQIYSPGALPYWGMAYDSTHDTGGAFDAKVFFKRGASRTFKASLELQLATEANAINEFGWFETDATGSAVGAKHLLFKGDATSAPDPVGKKVEFKPTQFFGYYFGDTSEGGCKAYSLFSFNEPGCGGHQVVVFADHPSSAHPTFWIAAQDPPGCGDNDCNLTLVKVAAVEH